MHIISKRPFAEAARQHPNQRQAIMDTYSVLKNSRFQSPDEMRRVFPSLDNFNYRDRWWVMDIGGNRLRLIAFIQFQQNRIYIKRIVTHAEYDKLTERYRRGEL